jgi:hypothetical protein
MAAAALPIGVGFAAGLGLTAKPLGVGTASIGECDTSFTLAYTTSAGDVTTATVGDVADGCEGRMLTLTLTGATGASIGGGSPVAIPIDGDALPTSVNIPVAPQPAAESVAQAHVLVTEP